MTVLILTGMHRSGTSLTASLLAALGVDLGEKLLPRDRYNPKGYFEDVDFLSLQRSLLQQCCQSEEAGWTDWGWTESEFLDTSKFKRYTQQAQELLRSRQGQSRLWGWKDPRTTLLLDFWHDLLPDAGYIFVYRFPWDVADSVLRIAHPNFLNRPDFALKVWRFYNRHLLDFYARHKSRCILANINAILAKPQQLVELINQKFNIDLRCDRSTFEKICDRRLFCGLEWDAPAVQLLGAIAPHYFYLLNELDRRADIPSAFSYETLVAPSPALEGFPLLLNYRANQFLSQQPDTTTLICDRDSRWIVAHEWLFISEDNLESVYRGELGQSLRSLLRNQTIRQPQTDAEWNLVRYLRQHLNRISGLLALMPYSYGYTLQFALDFETVPQWFLSDFVRFLLDVPSYFTTKSELERYARHFKQHTQNIYQGIRNSPNSLAWKTVAKTYIEFANLAPLEWTEFDLTSSLNQRGKILEFVLNNRDHKTDWTVPSNRHRKRRLGILFRDLTIRPETRSMFAFARHCDRQKFEVKYYCISPSQNPLTDPPIVPLPATLQQRVATLRRDRLDLLWIGENITADSDIAALASHRLARIQLAGFPNATTTGLRHVDYFVCSQLSETPTQMQRRYCETPIPLEIHNFCFATPKSAPPKLKCDRPSLGIADNAIVYASAISHRTIAPQVWQRWAKILAAVPQSAFVLVTLTPETTGLSEPMRAAFDRDAIAYRHVPLHRYLDLSAILAIADIYLHPYPHGDLAALVMALTCGCPSVVANGTQARSRSPASLLQSLQLWELATSGKTTYAKTAIHLGLDPELRQAFAAKVRAKLHGKHSFLDSQNYSKRLIQSFKKLL